jgi:choline dehydrogenase-like flavoprotein
MAIGVGDSPAINVTMGRAVGGSSLLTGGVCFRIPEPILARWRAEHGLRDYTPEAMAPYHERVERRIHVEEVPASMRSRSTALFAHGAERRGYPLSALRRNTKGCNGCGRCNFGCPHGAKQSVDLTYLPAAVRAGADIFSHCLVERVVFDGDRAVGVAGRILNRAGGKPGAPLEVRAKRVVIAAGAWHTPLLLKRSGVGRRSRQVGRNLTLHPAFRLVARFDDPVRGWAGALQSAYTDRFEDEGITMVGLFVPPAVLGATMPGIGPEHTDNTARIDRLAMFGGLIHDEGGGTVRRGPGREPIVTYRMGKQDRARIPRVLRLLSETFFEAGAREVYLPILGQRGVNADELRRLDLEHMPGRRFECASQHPLGSARMGSSPERSVADGDGRVWETRDLYVADGSVIPTSLGVNPQLSIVAVATRIAHRMRAS